MYVFGEINKSSTFIENNLVNYTQNLSTSSVGISSVKITSGSTNNNYWQSLNVLFYTSGSPRYSDENLKFAKESSNLSIDQIAGNQYLHKYHGYPNSTVIAIPQSYYGEKIKEGSFKLTDLDNVDLANNKPIIIDDGLGNLYSTNAHHSQSAGALSSSDNYAGNIFYEHGIAVITETGSWSGSVDYSDLATNFNLQFDSSNTIVTYEYNVNISPQEYNLSTNYTLRDTLSTDDESLTLSTPYLKAPYTGSDFQPYITTINLYQDGDYGTPVIQATLPRPIRKSDKINTRFKIKLDI
tara:strand:+ start:50 stop:937 length:888 start_codon:yes stop_codon:yes gene_type:complete